MAKKFKPSLLWLSFELCLQRLHQDENDLDMRKYQFHDGRLNPAGFKELFKIMRKIAIIFKIDRLWLR
ncbi:hypothetical protein TorRG33x02_300820 [Trema orientale]|uniref:Uncharacterized protein n=1 Tax=Trema orientale TaxID=63057 RepID=A0A2P5C1L8_TREOI|nr:hypothetical protein TorRG33x02_300820 [Trema orientale]